MKGGCKEHIRVFEEQKSIEQEAQNVAIAIKMVNLYHASLCLARGQLKLSASQLLPDVPPTLYEGLSVRPSKFSFQTL